MNSNYKKRLGQEGENFAIQLLQNEGLKIIARNFRCPVGEMDIIAQEDEQILFLEVRTRTSQHFGWGEESISPLKRKRLLRIAEYYILSRRFKEWPSVRFDVVAIRWKESNPEYQWIKGI